MIVIIHGVPGWYVADLAKLKELLGEVKRLRADLEILSESLKELTNMSLGVQDGIPGEGG